MGIIERRDHSSSLAFRQALNPSPYNTGLHSDRTQKLIAILEEKKETLPRPVQDLLQKRNALELLAHPYPNVRERADVIAHGPHDENWYKNSIARSNQDKPAFETLLDLLNQLCSKAQ